MLVIVEGADLVGKSTLVERLAVRHNLPIIKLRWALRGDPEIETRAMAATTIGILRATQPRAIFDRAYFSWWAYAPALGYDASYMPELIAGFTGIHAHVIVLTASDAELRRRYERQPDAYFSLDVILAANARFPSLLPLLPPSLPRLHIDTSVHDADAVYMQAEAFLRE
jgi:hypothetical protein